MSGNGNEKKSLTADGEFYNGNSVEFTTIMSFFEKVRTGLLSLYKSAITQAKLLFYIVTAAFPYSFVFELHRSYSDYKCIFFNGHLSF